jgi:hypothetical protein
MSVGLTSAVYCTRPSTVQHMPHGGVTGGLARGDCSKACSVVALPSKLRGWGERYMEGNGEAQSGAVHAP